MKEFREANNKADYIRQSYEDYLKFIEGVSEAVEVLTLMLSSKSTQDTVEAIKIFKILHLYGIQNAEKGLRKMLTLVFSKEESVINEAQNTYETLYFDKQLNSQEKTQNLLNLMKGATLTDLTCLEELLKRLFSKGTIDKDIIKHLKRIYMRSDFQALQSLSTEA